MIRLGCIKTFWIPWMYLWFPTDNHSLILRKTMFLGLFGSAGFRMSEHMTGLSVRATTVEISTDTTIVTVNWR